MVPASFPESNLVLAKPPGMTHEECEALSVFQGQSADGTPVVISCWKLTREEVDDLQRTGRVWLWIIGNTMPPAVLDIRSPFN
jgi:hypothetical protein